MTRSEACGHHACLPDIRTCCMRSLSCRSARKVRGPRTIRRAANDMARRRRIGVRVYHRVIDSNRGSPVARAPPADSSRGSESATALRKSSPIHPYKRRSVSSPINDCEAADNANGEAAKTYSLSCAWCAHRGHIHCSVVALAHSPWYATLQRSHSTIHPA